MMQGDNTFLDSQFLQRLERLAIINKSPKRGLYSGKRRSRNLGSSIEFADFRSYTAGDDFRQIDWNAYARHEKLFLKTYLDEQELHISLYVDCSKSMEFGEPSKFVTALKIAAALGYLSLHHFDRVSVYGFSDKIHASFPSLAGKGKTYELFRFLNNLQVNQAGDINASLATAKATQGKPGISVIISDFLFEEGFEQGVGFIQAANQEVILVQVLSEMELNPIFNGDLRFIDSESNAMKEVSISPYLLEEYNKALEDFKNQIHRVASTRGITYLSVSAEMNIEEIIFHIFKRAGVIR